MSKPSDYPREIIQKTAIAALKGYAAAFATRFQSRQRPPQIAVLVSPSHQLSISDWHDLQYCSLPDSNLQTAVRDQTDDILLRTFYGFTREMSRLSSRITKPLFDCVPRDLFRHCAIHALRSAFAGFFQQLYRQLADSTIALIHSMRSRSAFPVADEEYSFRRETRQRVFHEKGNAD